MADLAIVDKSSEKYKVSLEFINLLLVTIGKPKISDLTEFINIDREWVIADQAKKCFNNMESRILDHFDKKKIGWYKRNTTQNYILTFLRGMCNDIGLKFTYTKKEIYITVNGKSSRQAHTFYTIKNQ